MKKKMLMEKIWIKDEPLFLLSPNVNDFRRKENKNNIEIKFSSPRDICNCDWNLFAKINECNLINNMYLNVFMNSHEANKPYFLKQTNIGDCFLVSSIISLINMPGILYELFYFHNDKIKNYTDKDKEIYLYCFEDGMEKSLVNIKNTYPTFKNEKEKDEYLKFYTFYSHLLSPIPFTTSRNGILLGQILIKAYICFGHLNDYDDRSLFNKKKSVPIENFPIETNFIKIFKDKKFIEIYYPKKYEMPNLYQLLNKGGNSENVMEIFLGCKNEIYFHSECYEKDFKVNIIKKIKKYIKLGGFIQVSHMNHKGNSHSYSLLNYIEIEEEGKTDNYFSIINPWRDRISDFISEEIPIDIF